VKGRIVFPVIDDSENILYEYDMGMVKGASKYYESILMYRLCSAYVPVILYAGLEEGIENRT